MSSRKTRVVITDTALAELHDILFYTELEWGGEQREAYLRKITDAVARLEVMPSIGRRRDSLLQGLRSIPVGSHSLYYSQVGDVVYLRHILHNRRDPDLSDWQALAEDLEERPDE